MTWNYRIVRRTSLEGSWYCRTEGSWYCIREVHYEGDAVVAWSERDVSPGGESIDELRRDMDLFLLALTKPVLDEALLESTLKKSS